LRKPEHDFPSLLNCYIVSLREIPRRGTSLLTPSLPSPSSEEGEERCLPAGDLPKGEGRTMKSLSSDEIGAGTPAEGLGAMKQ